MKILFKQRQWVFVQGIFVIIGIITAILTKVSMIKMGLKEPIGGFAMGLHFISNTTEYTIPIFYILLSDLAFNVELIQGTFLTHLLCGKSRKEWLFKRLLNFYLFILIQFAITFILISLSSGIITGNFGLEGLKEMTGNNNLNIKNYINVRDIIIFILAIFVLVSFGVMITTFFPGKLVVGSILSIGMIYIFELITYGIYRYFDRNEKVLKFIYKILLMDPKTSWIFEIIYLFIFTLISIKRITTIEIPSHEV